MAIRNIRIFGDNALTKKAKEITEITPRIKTLIQDMLDTMYEADGVGLAAPQVGVLKKLVVIDVSSESDSPVILINPVIIETDGEQRGYEGCLSLPGKSGIVARPNYAKVKAYNENMEEFTIEGEGLLARALCHEIDHLYGILYTDMVEGKLIDNEDLAKMEELKTAELEKEAGKQE